MVSTDLRDLDLVQRRRSLTSTSIAKIDTKISTKENIDPDLTTQLMEVKNQRAKRNPNLRRN